MKILVTGGCGFVGSHIVDLLVKNRHEVAVVDNLCTGNINNLNPAAKFHQVDIRDEKLREVFSEVRPEVVYHEAAQIDIQKSIKNPAFDASTNILGTINLLECCRDFGVKKIIYASSAAVYGDPAYLPIDEAHPIAPASYYGISKYTPELYIKTFAGMYGLKYTILRYANVYGVRQDPKGEGGVVCVFTDKIINGQAPVVFGDGEQTRDFVYVRDVAGANLAALNAGDNQTVQVSTGVATSINTLCKVMFGQDVKPEYKSARVGDVMHSCMKNEKLRKVLGYELKYDLSSGIGETLEYYIH